MPESVGVKPAAGPGSSDGLSVIHGEVHPPDREPIKHREERLTQSAAERQSERAVCRASKQTQINKTIKLMNKDRRAFIYLLFTLFTFHVYRLRSERITGPQGQTQVGQTQVNLQPDSSAELNIKSTDWQR